MNHLAAGKSVVNTLVAAGHIAYFAGGWVRDYLLKRASDDIDIATSATVEEIQKLFPHTIPVGIAFGIVIVVHDGHHFEVATFRQDSGYLDGRRPTQVVKSSPQEDAKRRDFTINGMFWDPLREILYDFVGGQEDLNRRIIRAIGDPHERFLEDRLRMMRAIRYATRFDFSIDEATQEAIVAHACNLLPCVAIERVWQEFKKMSQFAHFEQGLVQLHRTKLLGVIFPYLKEVSTQEIERRVCVISRMPKEMPTIAQLMVLFPEMDRPFVEQLCDDLKVSAQERSAALFIYETRQRFAMPSDWLAALEDYEWVKWYAHPLAEQGLLFTAAYIAPQEQQAFMNAHTQRQRRLHRFIERMQSKNPVVRAEHLIKEGVAPSKTMGLLLQEAERVSINHHLQDPERVIALLKHSALWARV